MYVTWAINTSTVYSITCRRGERGGGGGAENEKTKLFARVTEGDGVGLDTGFKITTPTGDAISFLNTLNDKTLKIIIIVIYILGNII